MSVLPIYAVNACNIYIRVAEKKEETFEKEIRMDE